MAPHPDVDKLLSQAGVNRERAAHARRLADEISDELARESLGRHAEELTQHAEELERQAAALQRANTARARDGRP